MVRQFDRGAQLEPRQQRRIFEILDQQSSKLAQLITRLLDYTRIDAGKLVIEKAEVKLCAFVNEIIQQARSRADGHEIRFECAEDLSALLDPMRIEQVLVNLLDNAAKYSPAGTTIEVRVERAGDDHGRIRVRDHGGGVAPDERIRIFERFYRARGTLMSGSGLGLYVSDQIVRLHGGTIEVEAPADGGSCFVVTLPLGESPHQATRRPA
jgi:signal transduction histidine kinase